MELNDSRLSLSEIARRLAAEYEVWASRVGVKPWPVPPISRPAQRNAQSDEPK